MDDAGIVTPAQERYNQKKEAILVAATEILNAQGVKGMTLANVAAKVGLITTSVTYYYKKKDDLAAACFLRGLERFDAIMVEAAQATTSEDRILRFLDLYLDFNRRVRLGEAAPMTSFTETKSLSQPLRAEVQSKFIDLFRRMRGFFDSPDFAHLSKTERNARAHLLLEQAFWARSWLPRYDVDDYGRVRDKMFDILINGIAAPGRTWAPTALPDLTPEPGRDPRWSETILVTATRLFNRQGYRGTSIDDICAALNVTKGSFYYRHDDKDALGVACFRRTFGVIRDAVVNARNVSGDMWDKVVAASAALVEYQLSDHGPLLRGSAMGALPQDLRDEMTDGYRRDSARFRDMIADGIADGSLRTVDPTIAAYMINSVFNAAASLQNWAPGVERDTIATIFARPLLLGVVRS